MRTVTKARLWGLLALALAIAWFIWGIQVAQASGDCRGNSCNDGDTINVGGDTIDVGGDTINVDGGTFSGGDVTVPVDVNAPSSNTMHNESKSLALGNVLGDVDIADCLGSTQWSTPVFGRQGLILNNVCMAEFYLSAGKYHLAAMALCNVKEILKEFASEEECELAHDFTPPAAAANALPAMVAQIERQNDEELAMLRMEQAQLQEQVERQQRLLERAERRPEPVIVHEDFVTDEKRARIKALFAEDDGEEGE